MVLSHPWAAPELMGWWSAWNGSTGQHGMGPQGNMEWVHRATWNGSTGQHGMGPQGNMEWVHIIARCNIGQLTSSFVFSGFIIEEIS